MMTIREAIERLQAIAKKHGDDVPVFFDCPKCGSSFTPTTTTTVATHFAAKG